jgi:hypothetical protein
MDLEYWPGPENRQTRGMNRPFSPSAMTHNQDRKAAQINEGQDGMRAHHVAVSARRQM